LIELAGYGCGEEGVVVAWVGVVKRPGDGLEFAGLVDDAEVEDSIIVGEGGGEGGEEGGDVDEGEYPGWDG